MTDRHVMATVSVEIFRFAQDDWEQGKGFSKARFSSVRTPEQRRKAAATKSGSRKGLT